MERAGTILTFPAHSLRLTAEELAFRNTSDDPELVQKVAAVCSWWLDSQLPMEITTSGSTGIPKKITFQRSSVVASVHMTAKALNLRPGMNCLLALDPGFIGGRMMILRSLEVGMNLFCVQPASNPLKNLDQTIDFAALVPLQLETILNECITLPHLNSISNILVGGAPMSKSLRQNAEKAHTNIFLSFGMTETLSHIALQKLKPGSETFKVLEGIRVSQDDRGCLVIDAPALNSAPIVTNDLVDLITGDEFRWRGRFDRVINSGGFKISPEILEACTEEIILSHIKCSEFYFTSIDDNRLGQKLILVLISPIQPSYSDLEKIISELRKNLSAFEIPKMIFWSGQGEKTAGGKTNQKETLEKGVCIWPVDL